MLSLIYGFPLYYRSDRVHLYDHVVFAVEFTGNSVALCAKYNFRSALVCNLDSLWSEGFLFIWQENIFLMFIFIVTSTMFWSNFELQYNSSLFFAFLLCLLLMCLLMSLEDFYFFFFPSLLWNAFSWSFGIAAWKKLQSSSTCNFCDSLIPANSSCQFPKCLSS